MCLGTDASHPGASTFPNDDKTIVHVLNRIGFGPRPGDLEQVRRIGLERYIEQQLHPERIADHAMGARLAGLTTIGLSSREIAEQYELPALQARRDRQSRKAQADGGAAPPKTPGPAQQRANQVVVELSEQKILRAAYSERQLEEVLDRFLVQPFQRRRAKRAPTGFC